jgi:integrase
MSIEKRYFTSDLSSLWYASLTFWRRIGLTESALAVISALKTGRSDKDLLFPGRVGIMDPDLFGAEVWKPVVRAAKLPGTRFHDLRHFFASQLIAQGETPAYVRDQMGHASTQITLDT